MWVEATTLFSQCTIIVIKYTVLPRGKESTQSNVLQMRNIQREAMG